MLYNNTPGIDDVQFQREFQKLMRLEHHNSVKLVGYCYETQHQPMQYMGKTIFAERTYRALCFDYMQNGSLQKHITGMVVMLVRVQGSTFEHGCVYFSSLKSFFPMIVAECDGLDWRTRYKIIKGTCEGLKHLHEGFEEPIYHLDLKPDNILLDKNMVPKLADFGLSKLFGDQQTMTTQTPIGTM
jgi:serine/threonine protein kinase